ncbi:hypothetical protein JL720_2824 [Aureococcus anophagefferens]|nr:hypothetical protein JL720_2824 [Aureococcus anophagefferens]
MVQTSMKFLALAIAATTFTTADHVPLTISVLGTGLDELDGLYIRDGPENIAHGDCLKADGVLWRNGDAVIEGTDKAWRIAANGVWYFEAAVTGCDPGSGLAWSENADASTPLDAPVVVAVAQEAAPTGDVATLAAPLALRVAGAGDADGRYVLRRGAPVAGLLCSRFDGVFWAHDSRDYVLEAGDAAMVWTIAAAGEDWLYGSDAGMRPVDDGTRQYETWSWGASTKVRETTYKVCGIDAALFAARETLESAGRGSDDERLFGDLCAATDEASAAACVAALCSAEPSEGESSCPEIQHPPDAIVVTKRKTKDRSMTAAGLTASLVLAGLFVMFAALIVRLRAHELHRIKKVQPLGFTVEHYPSLEAGRIEILAVEGDAARREVRLSATRGTSPSSAPCATARRAATPV